MRATLDMNVLMQDLTRMCGLRGGKRPGGGT